MDALELIRELGQVEPADQAVIESALRRLAEAVGQDARRVRVSKSVIKPRWLVTAAAVAALAAGGTVAVAHSLGHRSSPGPAGVSHSAGAGHGGPAGPTPGAGPVAAILTAFNASGNDILMVTKTERGNHGTDGPTIIWLSPAKPVPGTSARSRILSFTLAGARRMDLALTYTASAAAAATSRGSCAEIFHRPTFVIAPAPGMPGTLTLVSYGGHFWGRAAVAVRAATEPTAAGLRTCLKEGQWRVDGHGVLGGVKVIELVSGDGHEHLWVSAATYLPVRLVSAGPGVDTFTFAFRFLPPTPANQAALTPQIPKGFAKRSLS